MRAALAGGEKFGGFGGQPAAHAHWPHPRCWDRPDRKDAMTTAIRTPPPTRERKGRVAPRTGYSRSSLCQTQPYILTALKESGLTVVPLAAPSPETGTAAGPAERRCMVTGHLRGTDTTLPGGCSCASCAAHRMTVPEPDFGELRRLRWPSSVLRRLRGGEQPDSPRSGEAAAGHMRVLAAPRVAARAASPHCRKPVRAGRTPAAGTAPTCPGCGGDGRCHGPCGDCHGKCHTCFGGTRP